MTTRYEPQCKTGNGWCDEAKLQKMFMKPSKATQILSTCAMKQCDT